MGRRILLTGLDTFWGGRVAAALEQDSGVEMLLGMGTGTPSVQLERTEFVRTDNSYSLLSRIVKATEVDTIVHTFLVLDSSSTSGRALHETNVIGTMNLLAAAGAAGSSVRQIVVKSSSLVYGSHPADPAWFAEDTPRSRPPRSRLERSLCEVESYVSDFALENPDVAVSVLRFANVLGADIDTPISRNLAKGVLPCVAGFDPLVQFVEEDDVVRCVEFAVTSGLRGTYNVAGDGRLPVSEVASITGAWRLPLPPFMTAHLAAPLVKARLISFPAELHDLLRYGRGMDTSRLAQAGFRPERTSAGAVERFAQANRLRRTVGDQLPQYRYEADIEAFFRHSPAVVRHAPAGSASAHNPRSAPAPGPKVGSDSH
jgi:UDP-glucose 4-epimerase